MAGPSRVLIAGGSGVFGRLLARELLSTTSASLVIAGRDMRRAIRASRLLDGSGRSEALRLDLSDREAFRRACAGCFAVVCAAGPFQALDRELPRIAAEAGAHWLDIGDDESWVLSVLDDTGLDRATRAAGVAVLPGHSTVPFLSGALARWCVTRTPGTQRLRIVLWIGNRNRRGAAAIASSLSSGFREPVTVRLPVGEGRAFLFGSPDRELLRRRPGIEAEFRVAFEWSLTSQLVSRLQGLPKGFLRPIAKILAVLSFPAIRFGSDAGCLQAEALDREGRRLALASLLSRGQRMAILPATLGIEALLSGELASRGVVGSEWLAPEEAITRVRKRGLEFTFDGESQRPPAADRAFSD